MKLVTIMIMIEICSSALDIRSFSNAAALVGSAKSKRTIDWTTVMPKDRRNIDIFPRSDKKLMVQLNTKTMMQDQLKRSEISGVTMENNTQKPKSSQKKTTVVNVKHFTVEQTTRRSNQLMYPRRRLMKKNDEILNPEKAEKKQVFINQKETIDIIDVISAKNLSLETLPHKPDVPTEMFYMNNQDTNRRTRQTKENLNYTIDDSKIVPEIDTGEEEDREEYLFLDGGVNDEFSDGPIKINLLDGILGDLNNLSEETESATEIELDDAEEERKKRHAVEEENDISKSAAPKSSSIYIESAIL